MTVLKEAPRTKAAGVQTPTKEEANQAVMAAGKTAVTPFGLVGRLAGELDRLFEDFAFETTGFVPGLMARIAPRGREAEPAPAPWTPRIEVFEREGQFMVRADLPGVTPEDVHVEVTRDQVTIEGRRQSEKEEQREGYYYGECRYGAFYRAIPLPAGADVAKATAEFRKGVLEVVLPMTTPPEAKARRLEVREVN